MEADIRAKIKGFTEINSADDEIASASFHLIPFYLGSLNDTEVVHTVKLLPQKNTDMIITLLLILINTKIPRI